MNSGCMFGIRSIDTLSVNFFTSTENPMDTGIMPTIDTPGMHYHRLLPEIPGLMPGISVLISGGGAGDHYSSAVPQLEQNFVPDGFCALHCGHCRSVRFDPHSGQNFEFAGMVAWQFGQVHV